MDRLTLEDVAMHSGVDPQSVAAFVDAGILAESDSEGFRPPDIARARLVGALIEAGVGLTDLAQAIQDGRLSLAYVDLLMPNPVRLVSDRSIEREWPVLGPAISPILGIDRSPGDPVREDDLAILRVVAAAIDTGAPVERIVQIVRAVAHAASKITDLQRDFIDEVLLVPAIERTGSPMRALEETSVARLRYRGLGRELTGLLMDRFVDEAIFRNLVQFTEAALSSVGLRASESEQTVVFVDVSDYTGRSEREGDAESARQAVLLTDFARRLATDHGGRMVKSLGDGAMMHASNPALGLAMAIAAVEQAEGEGLWPLHAGVHSGPMVRREGDFYGSAVNVAARVAGEANPGEVLVTARVVDALEESGYRFVPLGERSLRHVHDPVALFRAERRSA